MKTSAAPKQDKKKFGFTSLFPVRSEEDTTALAPDVVVTAPPAAVALAPVPLPPPLPAPALMTPPAPRTVFTAPPAPPAAPPVVESDLENELGASYKRAEALTDGRKRRRQNMIMRPDYLAGLRLLGEYRNSSLSQVNELAVGAYMELYKDELQKAKEWHAAKVLPPGAGSA